MQTNKSNNINFYSDLFIKTQRSVPKSETSKNAQLLIKGGYISKLSAGIYTILPLGQIVLNKIENIIREEMNSLSASELTMPALHPNSIWEKTGRLKTVDVLYKVLEGDKQSYVLGPTHEEVVTGIIKEKLQSYKDLPCKLYQIQTKFRDEPRARSGLLRGKEFRMKDLYSFHLDNECLDSFYEEVSNQYEKIFQRLEIADITVKTFASGGMFSKFSHEFQMISESGEDTIFMKRDGTVAVNKELVEDKEVLSQVFGESSNDLEEYRSIEVANIFKLGIKFTQAFDVKVADNSGKNIIPVMGCYGVGTTRLLAALTERFGGENEILWPKEVSPYDVMVTILDLNSSEVEDFYKKFLNEIDKSDLTFLIDDRKDLSAGVKLADAKLVGVYNQIIISSKLAKKEKVEIVCKNTGIRVDVDFFNMLELLEKNKFC